MVVLLGGVAVSYERGTPVRMQDFEASEVDLLTLLMYIHLGVVDWKLLVYYEGLNVNHTAPRRAYPPFSVPRRARRPREEVPRQPHAG